MDLLYVKAKILRLRQFRILVVFENFFKFLDIFLLWTIVRFSKKCGNSKK
jgi:hypothetical protein